MIQFQHIEYLFALVAIPVMIALYFIVVNWKKKTIKKIGDERLVKQLIADYSPAKFRIKFLIFIVSFALLVIAFANPRQPSGNVAVNRKGIDVMIALDVSKSMLAQDVTPNRLERAKQLISKLIDRLPEDRIGIVVFAGRAYLQMPLTGDHTAAKMYLSSASPDVVPTQGTVIGDALKMCFAGFNTQEKKYKAIVLISDGEDHDENAMTVTKSLADEGVMVNTVGIGSPGGSMILDASTNEYKKDAEGNNVITRLNEEVLKEIAEKGKGLYQLYTNSDVVAAAIDGQLKGMDQREVTENSLLNYTSYFPWFITVGLILLLVELFISERQKPVMKPSITKKAAAVSLLVFAIQCSSFAQNNDKILQEGNAAYNNKQYDTAALSYKKVTDKEPTSDKAQYNLGNALYKSGKKEDAIQAYDAAIEANKDPKSKGAAWYNKGVVLQNNKQLPECIEAYKNALRLNPADEEARFNLQKALLEKKKQDQQKQDQQKKKEDDKKKDQQKPKDEKDKNNQPKPQQSKMSKKEAEEKLKALLQQEKNLQNRLRKVDAASPQKPEKDW